MNSFRLRIALAGALLISGPVAATVSELKPTDHITADAFLVRAEKLRAKGPFALFSSDLKLLQEIVEDNGDMIHADLVAARAHHATPPYCPPANHQYIGARELIEGLRKIPQPERARIELQAAMRRILAQLHPCPNEAEAIRR